MSPLVLPELMSPRQVAELLDVSQQTLSNWRSTGRYALPFVKASATVRYDARDVRLFIESRRVTFPAFDPAR